MKADHQSIVNLLVTVEHQHKSDASGVTSVMESQHLLALASLERQRDAVTLALAKMAAREQALAAHCDATKVKVDQIELALAQMPGEFARLVEANKKR
jgi:hypothetical protein